VIPTILKVFLNALPKIIELLVNAFVAVLKMVPLIIKMIINVIPVLWKAIVKAVPLILDAFIESFNIIKKELFKIPAISNMFTKIEGKTKDIKKYFIDMYDKAKNTFKEFSEKLKQIKTNVMNFVNENIIPFFSAIKDSFMRNFEPIKESFMSIFNTLSKGLSKYAEFSSERFKMISESISMILKNSIPVIDQIIVTFKDLFKKLSDGLEKLLPLFMDFMDVLMKMMKSVMPKINQVINFIMKSLPGVISFIGDTIGFIIDIIVSLFEIIAPVVIFLIDVGIQLFDALWVVGEIIWDLVSIILTPFMFIFSQIWSIMKFLYGIYIKFLHPVVKFIFGVLWSAFKFVFQLFLSLGKIILDAIKNIVGTIKGLLDTIKIPKIGDLFSRALNAAFDSAPIQKIKSIFQGIMKVIEDSSVYKAWKKLKGVFTSDDSRMSDAKEIFKNKLKDEQRAEYLATYIYKSKDEARKKGTELGINAEMLNALENVGENLVNANGGQEETQKLFNDGNIVEAINKLTKVMAPSKGKTQKETQYYNNTLSELK
jgi:phage-related protein